MHDLTMDAGNIDLGGLTWIFNMLNGSSSRDAGYVPLKAAHSIVAAAFDITRHTV